jgi:putative transposase
MQKVFQVGERRACLVIKFNRVTHRHQPTRDEQAFLRMKIKEIAAVRIRYGYRRIHVLLKREGWQINANRVYRLYKLEGLNLRNKSKRKTISQARVPNPAAATKKNECWAMDFVSDQLYNGRKFRSLTLIDTYTRECLAIYPERSIKGEQVAVVLDQMRIE